MKGSRVMVDWARIHREWVERYLVTRALELIEEEIAARQDEGVSETHGQHAEEDVDQVLRVL